MTRWPLLACFLALVAGLSAQQVYDLTRDGAPLFSGPVESLRPFVAALPDDPVDCELSAPVQTSVGPWGACSPQSTQTRTEVWASTVIVPPSNGGMACGPLTESRVGAQSCTYVPPAAGNHAYFDALVARSDHWKSYSLRDAKQIALYRAGSTPWVDYLYATDPDPRRQDAAKIVIPEYTWRGQALSGPMGVSDTSFVTPAGLNQNPQITYRIEAESMRYVSRTPAPGGGWPGGMTTVQRGVNGTVAVAHPNGAQISTSTNSLLGQVRLPMGTQDGHRYLVTWEAWYGAEYRFAHAGIPNFKTFQFDSPRRVGGPATIWMETNNAFQASPTTAGMLRGRYYQTALTPAGPGTTVDPFGPRLTDFPIAVETWTRHWALIDQKSSDPNWTHYSLTVADPTRGPTLIFGALPVTVLGGVRTFWLEFNTSSDLLAANRGPLVSYVRNVVMLRDPVTLPVMERPK